MKIITEAKVSKIDKAADSVTAHVEDQGRQEPGDHRRSG